RARVPVDHVVVAVDQALLVQGDEDLVDRLHIALVEGDALVLEIAGDAESLELLDDRPAVLFAPLPDALDERFPAELVAVDALLAQLLLDDRLGRDPGV